jgi:hypothetical protein
MVLRNYLFFEFLEIVFFSKTRLFPNKDNVFLKTRVYVTVHLPEPSYVGLGPVMYMMVSERGDFLEC